MILRTFSVCFLFCYHKSSLRICIRDNRHGASSSCLDVSFTWNGNKSAALYHLGWSVSNVLHAFIRTIEEYLLIAITLTRSPRMECKYILACFYNDNWGISSYLCSLYDYIRPWGRFPDAPSYISFETSYFTWWFFEI